jgi:hypothetical protein
MEALETAGFTTAYEDGAVTVVTCSHTHSLDVIGSICTGVTFDLDTGDVIDLPVQVPGWHVNYIGVLPEVFEPYVVVPNNPVRMFATGGDTVVPSQPRVRARNPDGTFKADDPSTPDVNEAWESQLA